ncbi:hypothetical protein DXG03_006783 [Asterophora parasitica]|uniref:RNase III domain-containing protein n=1 Tax=Asterophora parasitica TaxID=117018 RepID=A0A9P7G792_9AGAR|nr:hypothetical protein DXG03_006783 [Asterophora parasitica]
METLAENLFFPQLPCDLVSLSTYLNDATNWCDVRTAPLPPHALAHALNAQRSAPRNNDVLEFVGDRVVNLACALVASKARYTPEQRTVRVEPLNSTFSHLSQWLARRLSSNDTLGRIAWQLRLDTHPSTRLDLPDARQIRAWTPNTHLNTHPGAAPPKALADLFEAYVGAVYCYPAPSSAPAPPGARFSAWPATYALLAPLLSPLLTAATHDVLFTLSPEEHDVPAHWLTPDALPWSDRTQCELLAWIAERVCMDLPVASSKDRAREDTAGKVTMRDAWHAEVPLPASLPTPAAAKPRPATTATGNTQAELEIGTQLLKLWTLDIALALVPGVLHARVGGAAFLSVSSAPVYFVLDLWLTNTTLF